MAVARQIDPAALARSFADEIRAAPEVKRLWYRYHPSTFDHDRMVLDLNIQLDGESKAADTVIANALNRLQAEYWDDLWVGGFQFTLCEDDVLTLDDLVSPDAIELRLHEA